MKTTMRKRRNVRCWSGTALAALALLSLAADSDEARAQAQSVPYSAANVPLDTGSASFEVDIDLTSLPARPRVRATATPDAGHADMVLDLEIVDCNPHPFSGYPDPCPFDWSSSQVPGEAQAVADLWECNPVPTTGQQCTVRVTALDFGSAGSPATVDFEVLGETRPVSGTLHAAVDTASGVSGGFDSDRVLFITDAANFRWIYDEEDDDIVETYEPVSQNPLGICEAIISFDENIFNPVPYTYTFVGNPSYVGYDCCTWRMDSPDTMTTGSGQALFYINVGLESPPPDSDGDGFFDPCDNCVDVPNGPFQGTCVQPDGTTDLDPCLADADCDPGEFCSMAQEDNDFDPAAGLVCLPEPAGALLLSAGALGVVGLRRRARSGRGPGRARTTQPGASSQSQLFRSRKALQ